MQQLRQKRDMVFVQVNLTTPYLFFIVPSTRVSPKPENKNCYTISFNRFSHYSHNSHYSLSSLSSLTLPILNRQILAGSNFATREYDDREFREFSEFKEIKDSPITPIILIIPITPIKTQRSCPLLHPRRSSGTHPPPRRGLGGGSGLQLPAEQAGVVVVSRGSRVSTLQMVLFKMIKTESNVELLSVLIYFEFLLPWPMSWSCATFVECWWAWGIATLLCSLDAELEGVAVALRDKVNRGKRYAQFSNMEYRGEIVVGVPLTHIVGLLRACLEAEEIYYAVVRPYTKVGPINRGGKGRGEPLY